MCQKSFEVFKSHKENFLYHNGVKLVINTRKIFWKSPNTWKANNIHTSKEFMTQRSHKGNQKEIYTKWKWKQSELMGCC